MNMKTDRNMKSTLQLVEEESVEGSLVELELTFDDTVNSPSEQTNCSKDLTIVEPRKSKTQLNSRRRIFSVVNKGQIIISLGVWVCCIIGLSKTGGLRTTHVLNLLSTASFISAGYIGIRAIEKPTKFRILFYVSLCVSSFVLGIVILAVNIQLLVSNSQEKEIIISEIAFYSVEVILASIGAILSRDFYVSVRIAPS